MAQYIGKGEYLETLTLKGEAKTLSFEIIIEEGSTEQKSGHDSEDGEEEEAKIEHPVKVVEVIKEHAPNDELLR